MTPHQNENPPQTPSSTPSPPLATTSPNIPSSITTVEAECNNITSKIIRINTTTVFAVSIGQGCLAFCLMIVGIISLLVVKDCKTEAGIAFCCAVAFFINGCLGVKNTRAPTKSKSQLVSVQEKIDFVNADSERSKIYRWIEIPPAFCVVGKPFKSNLGFVLSTYTIGYELTLIVVGYELTLIVVDQR
eukprot:Seg1507.6 transcript_id=Seg1507.6/GoldUCD/mRNA.D3Y31 product="hypothetical protein" protein_id=Seg1507.6/GoldUCD/D3Y31